MSRPPPSPPDFLSGDPAPVGEQPAADPADVLPQALADRLLALDGVDGAWIERDAWGQRQVVLHVSRPGSPTQLPAQVAGMRVRVVGGEPIRALSPGHPSKM